MTLKGTTICAVRKDGKIAVAGDGQVTMGESTIFKATAHKVRRIYGGKVVTGFAGTVSDAFALCDRFEAKLEQYSGNLERAAVELAQEWRSDKAMRKLEAMLLCADKENLLLVSARARSSSRMTASRPSAPAATMRWPPRAPSRRTPIFPRTKSPKRRCISRRISACSPTIT